MFQKRKEWNPLSSNKLVAKITAPLKFWKKYENHLKISSQRYERLIMTQCLSNIWRILWFCRLSHWSCFFKSHIELNLTCHSRGQSHCDVNAVAHVNSVKMTYGGRGERRGGSRSNCHPKNQITLLSEVCPFHRCYSNRLHQRALVDHLLFYVAHFHQASQLESPIYHPGVFFYIFNVLL